MPRAVFQRLWAAMISLYLGQGTVHLCVRGIQMAEARPPYLVIGGFIYGGTFFVCGLLATPAVRSRIQGRLRGHGGVAEETNAASFRRFPTPRYS